MSVAQQPCPGPAPDMVTRLRWALAATGLALVVVLALFAAMLVSMRRDRNLAPAASRGALRVPISARMGRKAFIRPSFGRPRARPRRSVVMTRSHPRVEIVERRDVIPPVAPIPRPPDPSPPVAPISRPPEPSPPRSTTPRPQRVLGERWTLKPPAAPPPAPALEPPLISLPPGGLAGEVDAPDTVPEPIARPTAPYPEEAAAEGVTGSVRLKVIVGRRGRVEDAVVIRSSGDARLDRAAEAAVRRWRYHPARREGRAVTAVDYAVIEFYREDREPGSAE